MAESILAGYNGNGSDLLKILEKEKALIYNIKEGTSSTSASCSRSWGPCSFSLYIHINIQLNTFKRVGVKLSIVNSFLIRSSHFPLSSSPLLECWLLILMTLTLLHYNIAKQLFFFVEIQSTSLLLYLYYTRNSIMYFSHPCCDLGLRHFCWYRISSPQLRVDPYFPLT